MQRQNVEIPADAACRLLEQAIALKALVVQAERDSLPVSDEEIDADIDNDVFLSSKIIQYLFINKIIRISFSRNLW